MKKTLVSLLAAAALVAGGGAVSAQAADDDEIVKGHVRTYGGSGIDDAIVQLVSIDDDDDDRGRDGDDRTLQVHTSASGRFVFPAVDSGVYLLTAWDPDETYAPAERPTRVTVGDKTVKVNKRLHRGAQLSGRVLDASGDPISGVGIFVYSATEKNHDPKKETTSTDADGTYRIRGMQEGSYLVYFAGEQRWKGQYVAEWYKNNSRWDSANTVKLEYGEKTTHISATLATAPGR
jgi:hypothetical protein